MESSSKMMSNQEEDIVCGMEGITLEEDDLEEKSRKKMLREYINEFIREVFDFIRASKTAEDDAIYHLILSVTDPDWQLDQSRKTISYICRNIFSLKTCKAKSLARLVIDMLQTEAIKYELQLVYLREKLATIYKSEKNFSEAAALLVVNFSRFDEEEYLANHKLNDCMKIANLYIEANNLPQAMDYLKQASYLQTDRTSEYSKWHFKFLEAKFRNHTGDHLESARRFVNLLCERQLCHSDSLEALNSAMSCIILAKDDLRQAQSLDTLIEEEYFDSICEILRVIRLSTFHLRLEIFSDRNKIAVLLTEDPQVKLNNPNHMARTIEEIRNLIKLDICEQLFRISGEVGILRDRICENLEIDSIGYDDDDEEDDNNSRCIVETKPGPSVTN